MKSKIGFALLMIGLLLLSGQALAGSPGRLGTAGAQELRIPVGSRATAMGGSAIADVAGVEALYWNPAGAADVSGVEIAFSHLSYIADINLNYFGITTAVQNIGTLGAGIRVLDIGDIAVTTEEFPEGTGATYSPNYFVFGLTYARRLTDRVTFGATGMYIHEKVMWQTASGLAFDLGFQYTTGIEGLRFGIVMKNYGPNMQFDGADFEYFERPTRDDPQAIKKTMRLVSSSFELPSSIQFGTAYELMAMGENSVVVTGNFQSNSFSDDEYRAGVEYAFGEQFFLRGGYVLSDQSDYIYGATFGAGLNLALGEANLVFDYTYGSTEFFDANQFFTVKMAF